jgi:hypothetical protein
MERGKMSRQVFLFEHSYLLAAGCSWSVARAFVRAYKSNSSIEAGSLVPQAPTRTIQRVPCPFPVLERHYLPTVL